jgi:signal transduction histidine kinase
VREALLRRGVTQAWTVLAVVGTLLVVLGIALADRLARSTVASIEELGRVTQRLHRGELDARVEPTGPGEVEEVGRTVNDLAERIGELLRTEREAAADLSHRLRTPLTALQLEADGLRSPRERRRFVEAVQQLTDAVSDVIREAREPRRPHAAVAVTDLAATVRERLAFWSVLADDQGRLWSSSLPDRPTPVAVAPGDLTAAVDALVSNVFAHTAEATGFRVAVVEGDGSDPLLVVEDDGGGIPPGSSVARGRSATGSTGLGLDIVRRTAERSGGGLVVARSPAGGARLEVRFGRSPAQAGVNDPPEGMI